MCKKEILLVASVICRWNIRNTWDTCLGHLHKPVVAEHRFETGHSTDFISISMLDKAPGCMDCLMKEAFKIRLHPRNFNKDGGLNLSQSGTWWLIWWNSIKIRQSGNKTNWRKPMTLLINSPLVFSHGLWIGIQMRDSFDPVPHQAQMMGTNVANACLQSGKPGF